MGKTVFGLSKLVFILLTKDDIHAFINIARFHSGYGSTLLIFKLIKDFKAIPEDQYFC